MQRRFAQLLRRKTAINARRHQGVFVQAIDALFNGRAHINIATIGNIDMAAVIAKQRIVAHWRIVAQRGQQRHALHIRRFIQTEAVQQRRRDINCLRQRLAGFARTAVLRMPDK